MLIGLLIPSALILRSNEENLATYHGRALAPAPGISGLAEEPKEYFTALQAWHVDRIGFGVRAGRLYRRVSYAVFADSPVKNIERGADDFVFLVSHGQGARMSSVADSCPDKADWPDISNQMVADWQAIQAAFKTRGITPHLLIIPSKKTFYAERLPRSVPRALRSRCLNMRDPGHPIEHLARVQDGSVIDAYPALDPVKNRPHFYPPENFHSDGESAMRAVTAALMKMGYAVPKAGAFPQFETVPSHADLAGVLGFQRQIGLNEPIGFDKKALEQDATYPEFIAAAFGPGVYARRYKNADAPFKRSVLLISNSFGIRIAPYFSSAFETVDQISTNKLNSVDARVGLFEEIVFRGTHDEIVFIFHDESLFKGRLGKYAEALARL
ncbi:MAG: hypothetical protein ACE37M_04335 [Henriciella sp.]